MAQYRIENGYSISKLASLADIPYETVRKIENSISEISSWRQYQNLAAIIGNDLLKADSKYKERKDKNRNPKKRSITFKNIATRGSKLSWEIGHKVVY
ncbi:helix-turn-helix domain-containing protein [Aerococcus urinaeequi]|uniref:helix-turn-helix domain-containing protein n=1 Tax=Aerococcus urinaeequi TaxID=51665 RepID=UPI003F5CBDEC